MEGKAKNLKGTGSMIVGDGIQTRDGSAKKLKGKGTLKAGGITTKEEGEASSENRNNFADLGYNPINAGRIRRWRNKQ